MKLISRILLLPICVAVLAVGGFACSSDKKDSATATPSSRATTAASPSAAATSTTVAAAVAATATVAPAAVANTPVPPPANTPVPPPQPTSPPAAPAAAALSVTIADFNFTPTTLTAKVGQPVTFSVRNNGPSTHTFSIQNGPSSGNIAAGGSGTVQFTAPAQSGGVRFFCMIHASMQGTLMVTN